MSLYVLDTDKLTLWLRGQPRVCQRILAQDPTELCTTIVTIEEILSGWYTQIRRAKKDEQMARAYERSHVVITPTTSSFEEGFCQVAAEAILAGRPLVASRVCPAVDHLGGAVVEVRPGDIGGYAEAIRRLASDPALYEEKRVACASVSGPYYDWNEGLGGMVLRVLSKVAADAGLGPPSRDQAPPTPASGSSLGRASRSRSTRSHR